MCFMKHIMLQMRVDDQCNAYILPHLFVHNWLLSLFNLAQLLIHMISAYLTKLLVGEGSLELQGEDYS